MAATDKDIVISPQRGSATLQPSIVFTGDGNDPLTLRVLDSATGSLSIEGSAGQLFGVSNNLASGSIFSANYASGIPAIDVNASGVVSLVPTVGKVGIGTTNPIYKLDVHNGSVRARTGSLAGAELGGHPSQETGFVKWAADNHHGIWFRGSVDSGGGNVTANDVTTFREYGEFQFWTGGPNMSQKLVITSPGNIGIGTTNPSYKLHVVGDINFTGSLYQNGSAFVPGGGSGTELWAAGTGDNIYRLSGNVGIGTTNPLSRLHVDGTSRLISDSSAPASTVNPIHYIASGNSSDSVVLEVRQGRFNKDVLVVSSNQALSANLIRAHDNGTDRFVLTGAGNVGIGTTNPQSKIHINAETGTASTGASVGVIGRRLSFNNSTSDAYGALNIGDWNTLGQRVIVSISSRQSGDTGAQYYENGGEIATLRFTGTGTDSASGMVASEITASSSGSGFGNTNTSPSDLIFRVSGSEGTRTVPVERLRIAGSGNVGIGTTNPEQKLHVQGSIRAQVTGAGTGILLHSNTGWSASSNLAQFWTGQTEGFAFYANDSGNETNERLRITASGNVGIGTTSPSSRLAVNGYITESTDSGTTYWNVVTQQDVGTSPNQVPLNQYLGQLAFMDDFSPNGLRRDGGSTDDVFVDSNGNVGIGTTSPTHKLDIIPSSSSDVTLGLRVAQNWGSISAHMVKFDGNLTGSGDGNVLLVRGGGTRSDVETFEVQNGNGTTFLVRGDGNVGIGTTSPSENLHVHAPGGDLAAIVLSGTAQSQVPYRLMQGITEVSNAGFSIYDLTATATRLAIDSTGNVGIGITNPGVKLDVNGPVRSTKFRGSISTTGDGGTNAPFQLESDYNSYMVATAQGAGLPDGTTPTWGLFWAGNQGAKYGTNGLGGPGDIWNNSANPNEFVFVGNNSTRWSLYGNTGDTWQSGSAIISGNVGIGTTNPATKLHLHTSTSAVDIIRITNGTQSLNLGVNNGAGGSYLFEALSQALRFGTSNEERMRITAAGNVGIGTTNPSRKLHIYSSNPLRLSDQNRTWDVNIKDGKLVIGDDTAAADRFTIDTGGNVGIGTTNPVYKFEISESEYSRLTLLHSTSGRRWQVGNDGSNLYAYNELNAVRAFDITSTGNVGIGTTNPSRKLHVIGTSQFTSNLRIGSVIDTIPYDTLNNGTLSWEGSAGQLFSITNNLTSGSIFSVNDVSGIPSIDVDANGTIELAPFGGNIGIGTTAPTQKLDVNGNIRIRSGLYDSNNSIGTSGYVLTSTGSGVAWAAASGGGGGGDPTVTVSATNLNFKMVFASTTANTTGTYGLLQDSESTLTYNPSTNTLVAGIFSGSGSSLTSLNASNISSGTVSAARLGSGTANSNTYLRGNNTWGSPYSSITEDILPSVNLSFNIGSSNYRWNSLYLSNQIDINGSIIKSPGPKAIEFDGDVVIPDSLVAGSLVIYDNIITPFDSTAQQYSGDKGVLVVDGNLDVEGDWFKVPVVETTSGSVWTVTSDLLYAREGLAGVGSQSAALVAGGITSGGIISSSEEYNGASWISGGSLNTSRYLHSAFGTQSAAVVFGGQNTSYTFISSVETYNSITWSNSSSLPAVRDVSSGCGNINYGLVIGGRTTGVSALQSTYYWNNGSWGNSSNLNTGRSFLASVGTAFSALAIGGYNSSFTELNSTEEYDSISWSAGGWMIYSRQSHSAAGTRDSAIAFGSGGSYIFVTEEYNGTTWSTGGNLNVPRSKSMGCGTQAAALTTGGYTNTYLSSTEEYTGLSFTPSTSGELGMIRYNKDTSSYQAYDGTQWRTISTY